MLSSSLYFLFLIPVGFSLAFMLWVLWSVTGELHKEQTPAGNQPMIFIRVRDRYFVRAPAPRMRSAEMMPNAFRVQIPGRNYSAPRRFSAPACAPTLGMGFRQASSSAVPGMRR